MAEYKIYFSGYALVEADSEREAEEIFWEDGSYEEECRIDIVEEL